MFAKSSPCLLGQHGSCSTAQQTGELSEKKASEQEVAPPGTSKLLNPWDSSGLGILSYDVPSLMLVILACTILHGIISHDDVAAPWPCRGSVLLSVVYDAI